MSSWFIYGIGFTAQILFSARSIIQWILSEKNKKVMTPTLFWKLSLIASFLLFLYGYLRNDLAIMLGQMLTYFIYIRNLQLQKQWELLSKWLRAFLWVFPLLITWVGYNNDRNDLSSLLNNEDIAPWLMILGIVAQLVFTFRFVYQWWFSEKYKESSLPFGFWLLSVIGAFMILTYGVFRKDPVLIAAHLFGITMYTRNIIILKKQECEV